MYITGTRTLTHITQQARAAKEPTSAIGLGDTLVRTTVPEQVAELNECGPLTFELNGMEPS